MAPAEDFQKTVNSPKFFMNRTEACYLGPAIPMGPHSVSLASLVFSLGAPFKLTLWGSKTDSVIDINDTYAFIPAKARHQLICDDPVVIVFLDPAQINQEYFTAEDLSDLNTRIRQLTFPVTLVDLLRCLNLDNTKVTDARILAVIGEMIQQPNVFKTIHDAAEFTSLSEPRFRSLFNQELGVSFRQFRLWQRMMHVLRNLGKTRSLTQLALESGFSSSSHFSTAFKNMFGISPHWVGKLAIQICIDETDFQIPKV